MLGSSSASMLMGNDLARKVLKAKATKNSALNVAPNSLATAEASTMAGTRPVANSNGEETFAHSNGCLFISSVAPVAGKSFIS